MSWPPHLGGIGALALLAVGCLIVVAGERVRVRAEAPSDKPVGPGRRAWGQAAPEEPQEAPYDDREVQALLRALRGDMETLRATLWRIERKVDER